MTVEDYIDKLLEDTESFRLSEINLLFCLLAGSKKHYEYTCKNIENVFFRNFELRQIFENIGFYYNRYPEITVIPFLDFKQQNKFLEKLEEIDYHTYTALCMGEVEALGFRLYSQLNKSIDDLILNHVEDIMKAIDYSDPKSVAEGMKKGTELMSQLRNRQEQQFYNSTEIVDVDKLLNDTFDDQRIISTGISKIDNVVLGVNKASITGVLARSGHGKTALGLQCMYNIAIKHPDEICLYFAKEQPAIEMVDRLIQYHTGVNMTQYKMKHDQVLINGLYKDREEAKKLLGETLKGPRNTLPPNLIFIDKGFNSIEDIYDIIGSYKDTHDQPISSVCIDHWHLLTHKGEGSKTEKQEDGAAVLVDLVKDFETHCFLLCQARKSVTVKVGNKKVDNVPVGGDDVKGSAAIKDACRQLWILHNPTDEQKSDDCDDENNKTFVIFDKTRNVAPGRRVELTFDGCKGQFKEW